MLKSHIVEASSFTQNEVNFKLPPVLCSSYIKLADLGVNGFESFPRDGIIGMLSLIKEIELLEGSTVLSSYTRNTNRLLDFITLTKTNNANRSLLKQMNSSNYGFVLNNGGVDAGNDLAGEAEKVYEGQTRPRICVDKKDLKRARGPIGLTASNLACMDLSMLLGFLNAQYRVGNQVFSDVLPAHAFNNLRLRITFGAAQDTSTGSNNVVQPYLIVDEVMDKPLSDLFAKNKNNLSAQYVEYELEEVNVPVNTTSSSAFLQGFYGKTIGKMVFAINEGGTIGSPFQAGENFRSLTINDTSYFPLGTGVDHVGKKAMYVRQSGMDLCIPSMGDRVININKTQATNVNADAESIYEGPANANSTESNFYNQGRLSYLVLPVDTKIDSMNFNYTRTAVTAMRLEFWAEVGRVMQFDPKTGAPVISYL